MDAKKAAKFRKPLQFTKTNAFKAINIVFAGLVGYISLSVFIYNKYYIVTPSQYRDNAVDRYFESDEYLLNVERSKGKAPPTREQIMGFWNKYMKDQHYHGTKPII